MTSTELNSRPDTRDLFDVRTKILQHTNPLRAKILVFSVVFRSFDFSTRDWVALKSKELYELLQRLYAHFATFVELEEKLYETARTLGAREDDRNLETARIVAKYVHRLYDDLSTSDISASELEPEPAALSEDDDETQLFDVDNSEVEWEDTQIEMGGFSTAIEHPNPIDFSIELDAGVDTSQAISYANLNDDGMDFPLSDDESENFSDLDRSEDFQESISKLDGTLEFPGRSLEFNRTASVTRSPSDVLSDSHSSNAEIFKIADRVADSLFRKMNLEEEIQNLVNQQVKDATLAFQNTLSEVESRLEDTLAREPYLEGLSLKYQALQSLTDKLQAHLATIKEILVQQEKELTATASDSDSDSDNTQMNATEDRSEASEVDDPSADESSEASASELLSPTAFIDRLDRALKSRGITTLATVKNDCLYISFESSQELNAKKIVAFVKRKIVDLDLETIERIKVRGRKVGSQSPDWMEIIYP